MRLLGRQRIYTDADTINKNNVVDVLQKAYAKHRQNVLEIQYLIDYERGEQPLQRVKKVRPDIDIQVNSSLPNYIKKFKKGYNWGNPILLVQRGNKEIHNTDENTDDSGISGLNEMLKNGEDISFKDQRMAEFIEICGIGHRMIEPKSFPKEVKEESYVQQMKASQNLANAKEEEKTAYEELRKAHEEYNAYLEAHPTYAQTGTQGLFEGDIFGVEAKRLQDAVADMAEGVEAAKNTVSEAQSAYDAAGESISNFTELYEQSAQKASVASENVKKIFDDVKSGVEVSAPVLKAAFSTIGIELPNEIINSFSGKSSELKQKTIDLLSGLSEGKELSSEQLLQTFSSFGIELPDAMITALSGKNSDVQQAAISLLGQISAASESEREPLIEEFNSLGVGVIDDGIVASMNSSDNQNRAKTSVQGLFTVVKNAVIGEREPLKTEGKEDGKQLVEGTNSGIRDNQGSTKGVIGTWVSNITGWFTDFLGIASPSKVFRSFGGYTVEGFNEGLEREMGSTYSLIDRWSSGITDGFNVEIPRLDLEVPKPSFSSSSYNAGDWSIRIYWKIAKMMSCTNSHINGELR